MNQADIIKKSLIKYLDIDTPSVLDEIGVMEKLIGWRDILIDKCLFNELTDMQIVNTDNFEMG